VWLDRHELLVGDDFVIGLTGQLAQCDGLVCLLTSHSGQSSWCQAEVQRALGLSLPVIVVQRDGAARFPEALERLLRDVQRIAWTGNDPPALGEQVQRARSRRLGYIVRRSLAWCAAILFTLALASIAVWRMNIVQSAAHRGDILARLGASTAFWSRNELDAVLAPSASDARLLPALLQLADDVTQSVSARHNAWQASASLREDRERQWRLFVPDLTWTDGRIRDGIWSNVSYGKGTFKGLIVERSRIAGVVLGPGPSSGADGLSLVGVRIVDSDAWFLRIDSTQLLDVEFRDVRFRGAQLDLSGHAGVRFVSTPADPNRLTGSLAIVEDSWIVQHQPLPEAQILDLSEPEQEILFEGVQFRRTRFEGNFKPQWFRNNHFEDCVFATTLDQTALAEAGNTIERSIWAEARQTVDKAP